MSRGPVRVQAGAEEEARAEGSPQQQGSRAPGQEWLWGSGDTQAGHGTEEQSLVRRSPRREVPMGGQQGEPVIRSLPWSAETEGRGQLGLVRV